MKLYNSDFSTLMEVRELHRDGTNLTIKGTVMGAMPVTCILTPDEARGALKLVGFKGLLFLLSLPFRSTSRTVSA